MADIKTAEGWAVLNRNGDIITSTVARTRVQSIKAMVGTEDWRRPWHQWKKWGSRCIKVRIVPERGDV